MTMKTLRTDESAEPVDADDLEVSSALFRALGEPARLQILVHLHLGPHRVTDLVAHLGLAQSTVSQHLACLRDCGLVESRPQGRASFHSLVPGVPIDALLVAAGAVTSVAVRAEGH